MNQPRHISEIMDNVMQELTNIMQGELLEQTEMPIEGCPVDREGVSEQNPTQHPHRTPKTPTIDARGNLTTK